MTAAQYLDVWLTQADAARWVLGAVSSALLAAGASRLITNLYRRY